MGWFDGWTGGGSAESDPLRKLDPKLREFLEKESPVKFRSTSEPDSQDAASKTKAIVSALRKDSSTAQDASRQQQQGEQAAPNAVPRESLYQDGRYAHLWRSYKSLGQVESETKSDHEKLMDVLDGYKERKARIGRAALENCALEQVDWTECMKRGDLTARMTLCREQVRKFERCYSVQSRLLKGLGYLSSYERSEEFDEQIQMHADTLYHRMMEQEAAIDAAKAEGRPIPKFEPVVPKPIVGSQDESAEPIQMSAEAQLKWKERLEKLAEEDRPAEAEAIRQEMRAKQEMAAKVRSLQEEQAKERAARRADGKETVGDRVTSWFGWK